MTITDERSAGRWPFEEAVRNGGPVVVDDTTSLFGPLCGGPWPEPSTRGMILPLARGGQDRPSGFLVIGASPRRPFDDAYQDFFALLAQGIASALANVQAYEAERKRAESLAELDRAKTAFFSNVSHEFRTPLTLMLGPLDELRSRPQERILPEDHELLETAYRNSLRLLKLVNTMLDFSRIEAGRVQAVYEPTDLARL
jgi:signal transduction histidine kinase